MDKEIKEMAERLAKSFRDRKDIEEFSNLIKEMGLEAAKKAAATLEPEAQELFKKSLEKAVSMDKEAQEKTGPESKQEESEDAVDEEATKKKNQEAKGEKMVKESNAKVSHQGDNSELPGQVIKSEEEPAQDLEKAEKEKADKEKEDPKEEKKEKDLGEKMADAVDEMAEGEAEEAVKEHEDEMHKKDKKDMKKSEEESQEEPVEKGAFKELAIEELEKGELLEKMIEKMRKRGMDHDVCMSALKKKGYDVDMAKGKWADMEKAEKEAAAAEAKETKADEKKEHMKKSVQWASANQRIEVSRKRGQNAHYGVDGYIADQAIKKAEAKEKGEVLEKSEKEFDPKNINDIIEKGYDRSMDQVGQAEGLVKSKAGAFNTASFSEEELAKAHNMTVEEMREVLGYPKQ